MRGVKKMLMALTWENLGCTNTTHSYSASTCKTVIKYIDTVYLTGPLHIIIFTFDIFSTDVLVFDSAC